MQTMRGGGRNRQMEYLLHSSWRLPAALMNFWLRKVKKIQKTSLFRMPVQVPLNSSTLFLGFTPAVISSLGHSLLPKINLPVLHLSPGHASITSCQHCFNYFPGNIHLLHHIGYSLRNTFYLYFVFPNNDSIAFIEHLLCIRPLAKSFHATFYLFLRTDPCNRAVHSLSFI